MEQRLTRLEVTVQHVHDDVRELRTDLRELRTEVREVRHQARTDFRLLFGALISLAIGMATLMAKGFHWI